MSTSAVVTISPVATSPDQSRCYLYRHDSSTNRWNALVTCSREEEQNFQGGGGGGVEGNTPLFLSILSPGEYDASPASSTESSHLKISLNGRTTIVLQRGRSLLLQRDESISDESNDQGGKQARFTASSPPRSPYTKSSFSYVLEFLSVPAAIAAGNSITALILPPPPKNNSGVLLSSASSSSFFFSSPEAPPLASADCSLASTDRQTLADYIVRLSFDASFRDSIEAVDKLLSEDEEGFRRLFA